ncbi:MAG TPA: alpha/beta fold hydrolase [Pyrinomonadaceae bacterium]
MQKKLFCAAVFLFASLPCIAQKVSLTPCEVPSAERGKNESALCGKFEVFEDRAAASGRKIALNIVVYPATGSDKLSDPLFYIPGGPGSSATEDAPYVAKDFSRLRARRDLVFVDQRGAGGSNPLNCELFDPDDIHSYLGHWNPPAAVAACRKELEKTIDLKLYVTSIAMDDLEDVRKALGYGKINLAGTSYGTRAVMAYVRQHPSSVRSIFLHGVSPFDQFMPREFPWHMQRALNGVLDECLADAGCGTRFPDIKKNERAVLETLKKGPVEVDVVVDGKPFRVKLSRDLAGEAIRYMLYQSGAASRVPFVLHEAAKGNYKPLAESAIFYRRVIVATGATGLYLSITCAEDLPFAKPVEGRDADVTFLGDYRRRQQLEACAEWPQGKIRKNYDELVSSDVPALIYSGQWDPVTPPEYGERVAKLLPNSLHVVVPSGGHGFGGLSGLDCLEDLTARFFEAGSAKGLDTACVRSIKRAGFVLEAAKK